MSAKGAKKKADDLFSRIIRSKGFCENCGNDDYSKLQCAHIISRRYSNTRVDFANALCLDAKCHLYFTDHPLEFASFVHSKRSPAVLRRLQELSQSTAKVDWTAEVVRLAAVAAELDAA